MKISLLFAIFAIVATAVVAIDSDDYTPEDTLVHSGPSEDLATEELVDVSVQTKTEVKAKLSASVMMRLEKETKHMLGSMAFKSIPSYLNTLL